MPWMPLKKNKWIKGLKMFTGSWVHGFFGGFLCVFFCCVFVVGGGGREVAFGCNISSEVFC